jgi:phenylacetic acid degradation operon negative regulatory protein
VSTQTIDNIHPGALAQQPRSLIVTIYGLYARDRRGWMSVSTLIRLLAELGVDEPAVRSSVSRLKRRGMVVSERIGGSAGYALSDSALAILDEGDRRIFDRPRATAGEDWLLAVFSVPESERSSRHMLRSRLSWLGFGTVTAGVWIAPAHLENETRDVLVRYGLDTYVDLFRSEYLAFGDVRDLVRRSWNLGDLQVMYDEFIAMFAPVLASWRRRRSEVDDDAFRDYVSALTAWRRLPFLDPGLPDDVLPAGWPGVRAADVFFALRDRLAEPAQRFVDATTASLD